MMQFLACRKHGSLGTRILRFNRETKITKQCKNYPEIHDQTNVGGRTIVPMNTSCVRVVERPRCFWVCRTMHHKSLGLGSRRMASLIDSCYSTSKNSQTSHEWVGHCAWL